MELEPGPFWQREDLPLGPRVATPHLFESLAGEIVPTLQGADAPLAAAAADVGRNVPTDLDSTFSGTIGAAEQAHYAAAGAEDRWTVPGLIGTGTGYESYRGASLSYLPQPSAPIDVDFTDPPPPPHPGDPPDDRDPYDHRI